MTARLTLRVLSETDVARLHAAALDLIGEDAAAAEEAAAHAPANVVLAGRDPARDVVLDGTSVWLAAGGPAALARPADGGRPRRATSDDLNAACLLADALPEVGVVVGPPVRAADRTPLGELQQCLETTAKHVQVVSLRSAGEAEAAIRLAAVIAGGVASLAERPVISLRALPGDLEAALVFARAGLPVGVAVDPTQSSSAAVTDLAAAVVRHHAAVLRGCRAVQERVPGAPFIYAIPALTDLNGAHTGEPVLFVLAAMQLAAHVRLPISVEALTTDAEDAGWMGCADHALGALAAMSSRGALVSGAGTLSRGSVFSAPALALDAELFSWNAHIAAGIPVEDGTLALEGIKRVGIGGNHLGERHTRTHMRGVWRPRLLDRSPWEAWVGSGCEGSVEKAGALVRQLLEDHEPAPLERGVHEALTRIVAESGL